MRESLIDEAMGRLEAGDGPLMNTMRILGGVDVHGMGLSMGIEAGVQGSADVSSGYLDATGLTVVPGFIDLQVNGAFGHDFTTDPSSIWEVGARLPESGVTSFCPTIITSPPGTIEAAAEALSMRPPNYIGAEPLGLHVEGPFLAEAKRGTHPIAHLRAPTSDGIPVRSVAIVTIAPELPGALDLISMLTEQAIIVSIGHSEATAAEARAAIDAGATMGTHLFNAMPPITAREPGLAGVLLADRRTHFGYISDGHHHDPAVTQLAFRAAPDRFVIITDAVAAAGMPDGEYAIGEVDVVLADGAVRNRDGRLAGAASLMDRSLRVLMRQVGATLEEAVPAVTENPANAVRRRDLGRIQRGARGDVTLLDGHRVVSTVVGGRIVHIEDSHRWRGDPNALA